MAWCFLKISSLLGNLYDGVEVVSAVVLGAKFPGIKKKKKKKNRNQTELENRRRESDVEACEPAASGQVD